MSGWVGRSLELTVGAVGHGGFCVARHDGRVVFVRHALPGERVVATVTEDRGGSYCRADAVRVLDASADRVPAACPAAGPGGCGGCDWQHAAPSAQLALKAAVVREALSRIAGVDLPVSVEPLPGGQLGWRTRVQLAVGPDGRAGLHEHRSSRVVPLADCPLAVPGTLGAVLSSSWPPGSAVEVVHDAGGKLHVTTVSPDRDRPARRGSDRPSDRDRPARRGAPSSGAAGPGVSGGAVEPGVLGAPGRRRRVRGSGTAVQEAAGRSWQVSADGFWQVHPAAAATLASVVGEWAAAPPGGLAWDLYGGVGLFAAGLAEQVGITGSVVLVESSRRAITDGTANLADLPQVTLRVGKVEQVLDELPGEPDVVVVDPPRRGLGRPLAHAIADRGPSRLVYVACDPASLARDVAAMAERGYTLAGLRAFDAFPMTHHVECVALLTHP